MSKFEKQVYPIMRIIVGFLFLCHGSQKLFNIPPSPMEFSGFIVLLSGTIEFFGGLLIFLGLFTRWAAFICSGEMAFAYWMSHGTHAVLPIINHGELALIYCFIFLYISTQGSGSFSIDHLWNKNKKNRIRS
jgi:putative oxidoreductase